MTRDELIAFERRRYESTGGANWGWDEILVVILNAYGRGFAAGVDSIRAVLRRVPIVRALPDGSGYACPGCGAKSGINLPGGAEIDEDCAPGCWANAVEAAMKERDEAEKGTSRG